MVDARRATGLVLACLVLATLSQGPGGRDGGRQVRVEKGQKQVVQCGGRRPRTDPTSLHYAGRGAAARAAPHAK